MPSSLQSNSGVLSLYLVRIKLCVTLNKGQGQYNYTACITMSEAVTMPSLMMLTSIVSEESLVRDTHTDFGLVYLKLFKVASKYLAKKKTIK